MAAPASPWKGSFLRFVLFSFAGGLFSYHLFVSNQINPVFVHDDRIYGFLAAPLGFAFAQLVGTFLHEGSHVVGVHLVGGQVYRVQIGSGRLLWSGKIAGDSWRIHSSLLSGMVFYGVAIRRYYRWRRAIITGLAPVASVLFFLGLGSLFWWAASDQVFPAEQPFLFAVLLGAAAGELVWLPGILLPFEYNSHGRRVKTDMLSLLTLPSMTGVEINSAIRSAEARKEVLFDVISLEEALARYEAEPQNPKTIHTVLAFLPARTDPRAAQFSEKLLQLQTVTGEERALALDAYLTICVETGSVRTDAEIENRARELLQTDPENTSLQGTCGFVLVDLGQLDEGETLLRKSMASPENMVQAYDHVALALIARQRGQFEMAGELARKAVSYDSGCGALSRVRDLLPESSAPTSTPTTQS